MKTKELRIALREKGREIWNKFQKIPGKVTIEPAMLLDGLGYSLMIVAVENIQMDKLCSVNLNFSQEICSNLSAYKNESLEHQKAFSVFGMWYGVLTSILPLFFVLFVGAWSDKYGRKPPLVAATVGHLLWALCYLLNAYVTSWPAEMLFLAALLDTMGGGTLSFLTSCNAYISDVTQENERTSRVGVANSIWFLGGPLGTLIGSALYEFGGYLLVFGVASTLQFINVLYMCTIAESIGPFAHIDKDGHRMSKGQQMGVDAPLQQKLTDPVSKTISSEYTECNNNRLSDETHVITKSDLTVGKMVKDVFDYHRILDSFRSTFRKREGHARAFVLLLIICNLLRKLGRGAYMYLFTRRALNWGPTDYGLWVSYKNFVSAIGSLVAVPILSSHIGLSDNILAIIGALAATTDYLLYGLVNAMSEYLIWIAPVAGLLVNSCVIAIRAMLSKFVPNYELGKVSAVMGALDGIMPMASFSLYTLVYKSTVDTFPGAQFFFGSGTNLLCTILFMFIICFTKSQSYSIEDLDPEEPKTLVTLKGFKDLSNNELHKISEHSHSVMDKHSRLVAGVLSGENYHIASTHLRRKNYVRKLKSCGDRPISSISHRVSQTNFDRITVNKLDGVHSLSSWQLVQDIQSNILDTKIHSVHPVENCNDSIIQEKNLASI